MGKKSGLSIKKMERGEREDGKERQRERAGKRDRERREKRDTHIPGNKGCLSNTCTTPIALKTFLVLPGLLQYLYTRLETEK